MDENTEYPIIILNELVNGTLFFVASYNNSLYPTAIENHSHLA